MASSSPLHLALIAVVNIVLLLAIQNYLATNYPDMNPTTIAIIATFVSTFVMAYLFRRERKKKHD